MYNLSKIEELSGGDQEFIESVVGLFIEEVPEDVGKIEEGIAEVDFVKVYRHAHKIKPNVDLVGLDNAYQLILAVEQSAKQEDLEGIKPKFVIIKQEIDAAVTALKADFNLG